MKNKILEELQAIAGWSDSDMDYITITGQDPCIATPFRVGENAAGIMAGCGLAAAKLWELRTGHLQHVTVDVEEATASLTGCFFANYSDNTASLNSQKPKELSPEQLAIIKVFMLTGCYKTKDDRWFYLHTSDNPKAALEVLGCSAEKEEVTKAIGNWNAQELEDALAANGANGGIVRTAEEWLETEQGKLLSKKPIVEITKIGDTKTIPFENGTRPLSGVRTLDLSRVLAGPLSARTLAEHGADVLWIGAEHLKDVDLFELETSHGKRAAFVDIRTEEGKDKLWGLISKADVFIHNYRSGSKLNKAFTPEVIAKAHPGIICAHINTYGEEGPWALRPGYEQIAQAVTGIMSEQMNVQQRKLEPRVASFHPQSQVLINSVNTPAGIPKIMPCPFNDNGTGYLAAFGIMVALYRRATEGGSYSVNSALAQSSMALHRMGRVNMEELANAPLLAPERIVQRLTLEEYTNLGHIKYVGPAVHMSETPCYYERPTIKRGTSEPVWLLK